MRESHGDAVNVRSARYWVARALCSCIGCGKTTPVAALALPPAHETLVQGDEPVDLWDLAALSAFLFEVSCLSVEAARRTAGLFKGYRPICDSSAGESRWANHCEHCGVTLEDRELFCEPEGAFFPTSPAAARSIELLEIAEPLEAFAGGYVCDPSFFEYMLRVSRPWLSTT
jgi:hypothetical protein